MTASAGARPSVEFQTYALSPLQIQEFFEVGYFVVRGLFSESDIGEMRSAFDRLQTVARTLARTQVWKGSQFVVEGSRIDRIVWIGGAEPGLLRFGEDPRLTVPAAQLLGSKTMEQLICQGHYKLPGDTVKFDWHQDSQHRGFGTEEWNDINGKGSYVQTMIAVDDAELDNGPVLFVPGTTKLGHIGLDRMAEPTSAFDIKAAVPMLMKSGDTAFFSPYVIHGSHANESIRSRRVFINGFAYPGANRRKYPGDGSGRILQSP